MSADGNNAPFGRLAAKLAAIMVMFFLISGGVLFGAAGTFDYPGAWILLGAFFIVYATTFPCYLRTDPEFLRQRMACSELQKAQRLIVSLSPVPLLR
jgi:ABC-type multidrug transport system permease subunit